MKCNQTTEHHVHCIHRSGAVPPRFPCPCSDIERLTIEVKLARHEALQDAFDIVKGRPVGVSPEDALRKFVKEGGA